MKVFFGLKGATQGLVIHQLTTFLKHIQLNKLIISSALF